MHGGLGTRAVGIHLATQAIGGAGPRRLGALEIDLIPTLGGVGENRDRVIVNFEEAPADEERFVVVALSLDAKLARMEGRNEWGVVGEDAEFTDDAGRNDSIDAGVLEEDTLAGDNFETEFRHLFR